MPEAKRILIANRGEIACRLIRTYQLFPLSPTTTPVQTVAIYTRSESNAMHVSLADMSHQLSFEGPKAYLDAQGIVKVAKEMGCWGIAPGYGFLSEDEAFAQLCEEEGLVFLGPSASQLACLGNKVAARELASSVGVPVLEGTKSGSTSALEDIVAFASSIQPGGCIILKAANGGGGRGIRIVEIHADPTYTRRAVQEAYESCSREAAASFGDGTVFAERFLRNAKHVEVQLLGDGHGGVCHFWDRECSLQRRNQKLIEIAPAPHLPSALRENMLKAALRLGRQVKLRSLATIEFLVEGEDRFFFMEANPRIQVEHTITENVTGVDLVAFQLLVGLGHTLTELGIRGEAAAPFPDRTAIQVRVNAESFSGLTDETHPESGSISTLIWPVGGGLRVETAAHAPHPTLGMYKVNPLFDSLLAKLIVTAPTYGSAVDAAARALEGTVIGGVRTSIPFLLALLGDETVKTGRQHIHTVQSGFAEFLQVADEIEARITANTSSTRDGEDTGNKTEQGQNEWKEEAGKHAVKSHLSGLVVKLTVNEGDQIVEGQELAVVEAMKMEHVVRADRAAAGALVEKVLVKPGSVVNASDVLLVLDISNRSSEGKSGDGQAMTAVEVTEDPDTPRPELVELQQRRHAIVDAGRTAAVAKRHARGFLTVRENLSMLIDPDSLLEYGDLALAAQKKRYSLAELITKTSGDGIVTGFARIEGHTVGLIMGDYLVLAGTQGYFHHLKLDRILTAILSHPAPLVLYAEGGGGRPGDTDYPTGSGLMTPSFALMGEVKASGIPIIGVANGYVFAGNAALLGTCDVVVATRGGSAAVAGGVEKAGKTSIGMGGKAMIEAGGLGVVESDDIGPTPVHAVTGGIDVVVDDEAAAALITRKIMGVFTRPQLAERQWSYSADVKHLRTCLPSVEGRRRAFDMRKVISLLVDDDSFIELAAEWGPGMITGFARIQGRTVAILANDPTSPLGGAIDINAALKAIRLLKLLSRTRATHLVSLCDTPGFMVGTEFERTSTGGGSFRTFGDWFTAAAEFAQSGGRVVGLVLRRAFGLGAQAMLGGSTLSNSICASWPAGSLGPMSVEGAVQLSMKKQLAEIKDPGERKKVADQEVERMYSGGRAINVASMAEIDTVLDPAETRDWLARVLKDVLGERKATYKMRRESVVNPHL